MHSEYQYYNIGIKLGLEGDGSSRCLVILIITSTGNVHPPVLTVSIMAASVLQTKEDGFCRLCCSGNVAGEDPHHLYLHSLITHSHWITPSNHFGKSILSHHSYSIRISHGSRRRQHYHSHSGSSISERGTPSSFITNITFTSHSYIAKTNAGDESEKMHKVSL